MLDVRHLISAGWRLLSRCPRVEFELEQHDSYAARLLFGFGVKRALRIYEFGFESPRTRDSIHPQRHSAATRPSVASLQCPSSASSVLGPSDHACTTDPCDRLHEANPQSTDQEIPGRDPSRFLPQRDDFPPDKGKSLNFSTRCSRRIPASVLLAAPTRGGADRSPSDEANPRGPGFFARGEDRAPRRQGCPPPAPVAIWIHRRANSASLNLKRVDIFDLARKCAAMLASVRVCVHVSYYTYTVHVLHL